MTGEVCAPRTQPAHCLRPLRHPQVCDRGSMLASVSCMPKPLSVERRSILLNHPIRMRPAGLPRGATCQNCVLPIVPTDNLHLHLHGLSCRSVPIPPPTLSAACTAITRLGSVNEARPLLWPQLLAYDKPFEDLNVAGHKKLVRGAA
eukprot:2661024-Pleurochrysis_carterae.AAC.11